MSTGSNGNNRGGGDEKNRGGGGNQYTKLQPLYPLPRSPEKPLAQCQVKPMLKAPLSSEQSRNNHHLKTDYDEGRSQSKDDFVPISLDKPTGLAIDDFLPVSSRNF